MWLAKPRCLPFTPLQPAAPASPGEFSSVMLTSKEHTEVHSWIRVNICEKISVIRIYGRCENYSAIRDPWLPVFDIIVGRRNNNSALQQLSWFPDLFLFQTKIKPKLFFFLIVTWNYLGFLRSKVWGLLHLEVSLTCIYQNFNVWQGTMSANGHRDCSGSHGMVALLDCKSHSLLEPIWAAQSSWLYWDCIFAQQESCPALAGP